MELGPGSIRQGGGASVLPLVTAIQLANTYLARDHGQQQIIVSDASPPYIAWADAISTATCWRKVQDNSVISTDPALATSITISPMTFILGTGASQTLTPTVLPSNASQTVSWSYDSTKVSMSGNVVTRIGGADGDTVNITTSTANGLSATSVGTLSAKNALKFIAQHDPVQYYPDSQKSAGYTGYLSYTADLIGGGDVNEIVPSIWMRYIPDTNNTGNDIACPNDATIEVTLQALGKSYHVTWDGGSLTKVLTAGLNDIQADPVSTMTAFGVASLPPGTVVWKKVKASIVQDGTLVIQGKTLNYQSGSQAIWYNVSAVTPADINAIGGWTSSGTGSSSRTSAFTIKLLGRHVQPTAKAVGIGVDSLTYGLNDLLTAGNYGAFNRANVQLTVPCAVMSFAVSGVSTKFGSTSTFFSSLLKYCPDGLYINGGTNDIPGITAAAAIANTDARITQWRNAGGTGKVMVSNLYPRTTSTDQWATTGPNQAPFNGWAAGGIAEQYNALLTTPKYDYVVLSTPLRDPTTPQQWAVNGTAQYLTKDGTHPQPAGYALQAAPIKDGMVALGWGIAA